MCIYKAWVSCMGWMWSIILLNSTCDIVNGIDSLDIILIAWNWWDACVCAFWYWILLINQFNSVNENANYDWCTEGSFVPHRIVICDSRSYMWFMEFFFVSFILHRWHTQCRKRILEKALLLSKRPNSLDFNNTKLLLLLLLFKALQRLSSKC